MPQGFHLLIAAQFSSALADNALLIVAIALIEDRGLPGWWAPLLKFSFVVSYVLLAPFVGPLADAFPKAKLMAWMNATKVLGVLAMLAGVHPVLSFAVVGLGAAAYAPAKYGLITEMVGPQKLVAANGWIEVTAVCAVLLGTGFGGLLVSDWARAVDAHALVATLKTMSGAGFPTALAASLLVLLSVYALAAALNLGIPDSGARYARGSIHPRALMVDFLRANRALWRDRDGGLSLGATTFFWGVGAVLQFSVLRWAVDVLQLPLNQAAYLQAIVAVGVVAGAALAGRFVRLEAAKSVLPAGLALGLMTPLVAFVHSVPPAVPLLIMVGAIGGVLVVPMNALLQHRGLRLLTAGRSIAVQGFNENLSVLIMLACYAALIAADVPIVPLMCGLGASVAVVIALLMLRERRCDALHADGLTGLRCASAARMPDPPQRVAVGASARFEPGAKKR